MRVLATIGVLAILAAIAGGIFFFGGFYSVAASGEDPGLVNWALVRVRSASISAHAPGRAPADLGDMARVQAGARVFAAQGCVNCHGGPGVKWAKFSEGLNPDPPDLKEVVGHVSAPELFWVVKNGIRMTGMPSFGAIGLPDKDIWSIVAFLKKLPQVSEADYKGWTQPAAPAPPDAQR